MSLRRLLATTAIATVSCATAFGVGTLMSDNSTADQPPAGAAAAPSPRSTPSSPSTPSAPSTRSTAESISEHTSKPPTPHKKHEPQQPQMTPGARLLGPGDESDDVRDLQARLKQIAWFAADVTGYYGDVTREAVRGFQAKREIPVTGVVDQRTLDRLAAMTTEPTTAELTNQPETNTPGALDPRCDEGRVLCIDKTSRTLRWVVDGQVRQILDVRFGASYSPTREGVFHVYVKDIDHVSHLYGSAMPYSMFFSRGQAVHYSSDFAARGYAGASHGCINVRDRDGLAHLYDQVRVGDTVVVYWS